MNGRAIKLMYDLRASYWFIPSVMAFLALVLGGAMVWFDAGPGSGLLDGLGWYQKAKPDGAHQVLSTIAGSMITVAGVVFSITIVAIAYAASQYGPRILTNFMSDRGNQVTLGTFIATFVYCLVVLRTIRGGEEGEFVPQLAIMVGLLLALCSIAVLIYFIHHVPKSIHINNVVAHVGKQLLQAVDKRFPAQVGEPLSDAVPSRIDTLAERALIEETNVAVIRSTDDGYIEAVEDAELMRTAQSNDMVLRLQHNPGDYVVNGQNLISVWPDEKATPEIEHALRRAYTVGNSRTPAQDIMFLVDELVEIAGRALSTGVNDPYTAMTCLDWLSSGLAEIGRRNIPDRRRTDDKGVVRVIAVPQSFAEFVERGFGRMRQYVARDMNAALHAFKCLATVGRQSNSIEQKEALAAEASKLLALSEKELKGPSVVAVREQYRQVTAILD